MDSNLEKVLKAREIRWQKRLELAKQWHNTIITVTACVPVKFRTNTDFKIIFDKMVKQLVAYLIKNGIIIDKTNELDGDDGLAFFFETKSDHLLTKKLCVDFEESQIYYRMLDVDIMSKDGIPISRSNIDILPRRCFICQNDAATCVSRKLHSKSDVETAVLNYIKLFANKL